MDLTSYLLGKKSGGGTPTPPKLQQKNITITENTTTNVLPDTGYDGLSRVSVTTNVSSSSATLAPSLIQFESSQESEIDLTSLDTSNMVYMSYMFYDCSSLESLDLSGFNTSNVTGMNNMFHNCGLLTSLDLSSFDTSNVTNMSYMFYECISLESLDLSMLDFTSLTDASYMFFACASLTFLDIRTMDLTLLQNYEYMFESVYTGCYIVVADDTQKNWVNTNFPDLEEVHTVAEYEANL